MRVEAFKSAHPGVRRQLNARSARGGDAGILLAEFINPARSIENLLFAGVERMTARADFDLQIMADSRARLEAVATAADDVDFGVIGMDRCFHKITLQKQKSSALILRRPAANTRLASAKKAAQSSP